MYVYILIIYFVIQIDKYVAKIIEKTSKEKVCVGGLEITYTIFLKKVIQNQSVIYVRTIFFAYPKEEIKVEPGGGSYFQLKNKL